MSAVQPAASPIRGRTEEMTVTSAAPSVHVTVGVDTHKDRHVAAVIDHAGRVLATTTVATTTTGFAELVAWAQAYGTISRVGVEGTGAYGAGLTRYLRAAGHQVLEVDRPNRQTRRRKGKSDAVDAEFAARAALSGEASGTPKARDGRVEAIRALRVARRSAIKARTQAANQLDGLIISAPEVLRAELRALPTAARVNQAANFQPRDKLSDPLWATRFAMRELACRHQALTAEIGRLEAALAPLIARTAPRLRRSLVPVPTSPGPCSPPLAITPTGWAASGPLPACAPPHHWRHPRGPPPAIA